MFVAFGSQEEVMQILSLWYTEGTRLLLKTFEI